MAGAHYFGQNHNIFRHVQRADSIHVILKLTSDILLHSTLCITIWIFLWTVVELMIVVIENLFIKHSSLERVFQIKKFVLFERYEAQKEWFNCKDFVFSKTLPEVYS